jgi:hypothetical protein
MVMTPMEGFSARIDGQKGVITMHRKVTPASRLRKELLEAVGASSLDFSGYCRLAAQAMLQTAVEIEAAEFVGRQGYERRDSTQGIYRNGYKRRPVATGGRQQILLDIVKNPRHAVFAFGSAQYPGSPRSNSSLRWLLNRLHRVDDSSSIERPVCLDAWDAHEDGGGNVNKHGWRLPAGMGGRRWHCP